LITIKVDNMRFTLSEETLEYIQIRIGRKSGRHIVEYIWANLPAFSIVESDNGLDFYVTRA
jgi:hypothetical protein